jgi:U3 small nucleolar RNA-associated protein 10
MASLFAKQLRQIAVNSTNELDLKTQKAAHAESLLFEKKVAGSQGFEAIYQICLEGYQDLCRLDAHFDTFQRSLFSPHSKDQDRTQMTAEENAALDAVLEAFLGLVASKLLLRPALKGVEWLVRRFR